MSCGSHLPGVHVPQQKIIGNSIAAFGQGLCETTLFLYARFETLASVLQGVLLHIDAALLKSRQKLGATSAAELMLSSVDPQLNRQGVASGVTQLGGVPRHHATAASILTGSTSTIRTWGSSHLIARGTGNGKTRSTEPQNIPSQEPDQFCRFFARSACRCGVWRYWRYLTCGSPSSLVTKIDAASERLVMMWLH
jgi:hypothetical protein